MRYIIVLIAIIVSFGTYSQEKPNKSRIGLAGSAYLNMDKIYKSNSQYFELNYDYQINDRVRIGVGLDYNLTNRNLDGAIIGMDSTMNIEINRSGVGAQVYFDYFIITKSKWDLYARIGLGVNVPLNQVTTETYFYQERQTQEIEFNTELDTWKNPVRYTLGIGGEYKIKDYLAIGLEVNYRSFGLGINTTNGFGAKLGVSYKF